MTSSIATTAASSPSAGAVRSQLRGTPGAGVIAASGLYTAYRERVRAMERKRLDRSSGTRA